MFDTVISFLSSIPDVIWSGVIASALTLGGVLISNRSNTTRLRLQLQHDAAEKSKERIATLRREVYLRTVEELVKINAHLASLPQIDLTKTNFADGMQGFFAASARLQLVAEPKTGLLVNKLAAEYGALVFSIATHLMPIGKAKSDIRISDDLCSKAQAEEARVLAEMARLNESGKSSPEVFQALQSSFDFHHGQSQKFASERSDAWTRFNSASAVFHRYLLKQIQSLALQQIPVMVEIRRDLGLTGDLAELEAHTHQQIQRMEAQFDAFLATLKNP